MKHFLCLALFYCLFICNPTYGCDGLNGTVSNVYIGNGQYLLTIKICKEKNILFLHPTSCRYPSGRFSFYKYDTVQPYLGSNELLPLNNATNIIMILKIFRKVVIETNKVRGGSV